jgi:hypothetical protein
MKTLTLRIDPTLDRWLTDEAKRLGRTKSQVVRDVLVHHKSGKRPLTVHDRMKDVCGIIKSGPRDTSANTRKYLKGFGE